MFGNINHVKKIKIDIHKINDIVNQTKIVIQSTMYEKMYKYWFKLNRLIKVNVKKVGIPIF